ncbi:hypothetical protein FRB90_001724 [Tulasnella sp. 427]|nr:hypothetical protein FRB90_001724 [Tulasnella sp. 427]
MHGYPARQRCATCTDLVESEPCGSLEQKGRPNRVTSLFIPAKLPLRQTPYPPPTPASRSVLSHPLLLAPTMLKRARAVSPASSSGSAYDNHFDDEERRRTKRVRFATGIGEADRNARPDWDEMMTEDPPERGRRVERGQPPLQVEVPVSQQASEQAGAGNNNNSSDETRVSAHVHRYRRSPPPPERTSPTSPGFADYAAINSLLGALNRSRTNHQQQQQHHKSVVPTVTLAAPPPSVRIPLANSTGVENTVPKSGRISPGPKTTATANGLGQPTTNLGVLGWRHGRATAHRHRPSVPSPLARAATANDDEEDAEGAGANASNWESELVRQRYEDTNKLLKSLVLSRRPAPEDDEEDEEEQ